MIGLLLLIPWALWLVIFALASRWRPRLASYAPPTGEDAPLVSVIVPARNEVENLGACVASLMDTSYPSYEVLIVDDRSTDGTLEVAEALAERSGGRIRVVHGEPLPEGWVGKPWACWQGYRAADGDVLLFTDADTRHGSEVLGHAVAALRAESAGMVTAVPRQILDSFWERVVMPQVLTVILVRYLDTRRVNRPRQPRDVIANGQFIMVDRSAYELAGGHEAVKAEIVEDLRLAQRFAETGQRLFLGWADEMLETRMYRSLSQLAEGWTKNLALGARAAVREWLRPAIPWLITAFLLVFWVVPPAVLVAGELHLAPNLSNAVVGWAAAATALSVAFWAVVCGHMRVPLRFALAYPLGALATAALFVRSSFHARRRRVTWRGRDYRV